MDMMYNRYIGWAEIECKAEIFTHSTSHVNKTRHAYQISSCALYIILNRVFVEIPDFESSTNDK